VTAHADSPAEPIDAERRRTTLTVPACGADLAVEVWDPRETGATQELVLLHGGAAHRHWWDHVIAHLRHIGRVVTLDLSGHGDSAHRPRYELDQWSDELGVVTEKVCASPPLVVGHSMGGLIAVNAAQRDPQRYAGVMALDSPLTRSAPGNIERRKKIASRPVRSYDSREEAIRGFRTAPPVPHAPQELIERIAASSIRPQGDRWALKFDPRIYDRPQVDDDFVREAQVPTWWVQAEHGYVDERMARIIERSMGPRGRLLWAPGASHHMILEQPQASTWLVNAFVQAHGRIG